MKKAIVFEDSRIDRENNARGYVELCNELLRIHGFNKKVSGGWTMNWDSFSATSYRQNNQDIQVDITLNLGMGSAIIEYEVR